MIETGPGFGGADGAAIDIARRVLAVRGGARQQELDRLCAGDRALRERVERAMRRMDEATLAGATPHAALDALLDDLGPDRAPSPTPSGRRFGPYEILGILGEGGMGTVYRARQASPRREVALKVMRAGRLSSRALARFEMEAQVLGRLHHPGIAQVHDAGAIDDGDGRQPYFAMELVRGRRLDRWHAQTRPSRPDLLRLFAEICDAVHHAHQKGVIHRDLKPANILVTDDGRAKVLDFGVARAADDELGVSMHTEVGQIVGTLHYMSPEQAAGRADLVDLRSDVYALGVTLYELLSGRRPLDLDTLTVTQAIRAIEDVDPLPLSRHDRALGGDLEIVVHTALRKDPAERYASASELAADLRRLLAHEPIAARAPSTLYLVRKFVRRHRALSAGVASSVVLLAAGAAGTSAGMLRALHQETLATRHAQDAEAVQTYFVERMLRAATPEESRGRDVTVREVFEQSAQEIDDAFPEQPLVRATLHLVVGQAAYAMGELDEASAHLEQSRALRAEHLGADAPETLAVRTAIGSVQTRAGDWADAEHTFRAIVATLRKSDPDAAELPSNLSSLAAVLGNLGRLAEAEPLLVEALDRAERRFGPDAPETLGVVSNLAYLLHDLGRVEEALHHYERVVETRTRLLGDDHPDTLVALSNLGAAHWALGHRDEAAEIFRTVHATQARVLGATHPNTLIALANLAFIEEARGNPEGAVALYDDALSATRAELGDDHPQTLGLLENLASALGKVGRTDEAEGHYRTVLAALESKLGGDALRTCGLRHNYGVFLAARGRLDDAQRELDRACTARRAELGAEHPDTLATRLAVARLAVQRGHADEARTEAAAILEAAERTLGAEHPLAAEAKAFVDELAKSPADES